MAKIALFDLSDTYIELLDFIFKQYCEAEFQAFKTFDQFEKAIMSDEYSLCFADATLLSRGLNQYEGNKKVIALGDTEICRLHRSFELLPLINLLRQEIPGYKEPSSEYCNVSLDLLKQIHNISVQLFVEINDKMVALTKDSSKFTEEEYQKYSARKLKGLYVHRTVVPFLVEDFLRNINAIKAWNEADDIMAAKEIQINTEKLKTLAKSLGWNEDIQEMTKKNLTRALYFAKSNPDFTKTINYFRKVGEFSYADHSSLSLMVSLNILEITKRSTEINKVILSLATLLHDISLTESQIQQKGFLHRELLEKGPRASDDVHNFFRHPEKSATLCRQWRFAPPMAAEIILQHHEKPDGSGFPNKLKGHLIEKNAAVFIISQDFADFFSQTHRNPNFMNYVKSRENTYNTEPFLEPFGAVKEMLKHWIVEYLASAKS